MQSNYLSFPFFFFKKNYPSASLLHVADLRAAGDICETNHQEKETGEAGHERFTCAMLATVVVGIWHQLRLSYARLAPRGCCFAGRRRRSRHMHALLAAATDY
jgi:hypothetical protein